MPYNDLKAFNIGTHGALNALLLLLYFIKGDATTVRDFTLQFSGKKLFVF